MSAIWTFNPFGTGDGTAPPYFPPSFPPDDTDPDAKCPYMESTPGSCSPTSSGTLTLHFDLSPATGCRLIPPVNISLYRADNGLDFSLENLVTGFSGVIGSQYTYQLPIGTYAANLVGQLSTNLQLTSTIDQQGMFVTGFGVSTSGAQDCHSAGSAQVGWSGWYNYSVEEAPEYHGRSFTGFSMTGAVGQYTLDISDDRGCSNTSQLYIWNANTVYASVGVSTGVSCQGVGNDGIATASGIGGVFPYSYEWFDSSGNYLSAQPSISGLSVGTYSVTVTDFVGCSYSSDVVMGYNSLGLGVYTSFTSRATNRICCQESATTFASLCAMAQGGVPPYNYQWHHGPTDVCVTGLSEGDFTVTITDSAGCSATSQTQSIRIVNDCFLVDWTFGDGNTQQYMAPADSIFNGVQNTYHSTGVYNVRLSIVDGFGQSGIACHDITVPPCPPLSGLELTVNSVCVTGSQSGYFNVTAVDTNGGTMPNLVLRVVKYAIDLNAPPYNLGATPTCDLDGFNSIQTVGLPVLTTAYGSVAFIDDVDVCVGYAVEALPSDNIEGLVPEPIMSNLLIFRNCISPPPPSPSPPSPSPSPAPPPPPPPPSPPPPPPPGPPGYYPCYCKGQPTTYVPNGTSCPPCDGPNCACCTKQGNGSWGCSETPRDQCAGTVQTLNGLSTGACYAACASVPNMVTDCDNPGKKLCREAQGMCCTPQGCVSSTPCNCKKMDPPGSFFAITKDFSQANDDCNKACTISCCIPIHGGCQTYTGPNAGGKCSDAGGSPAPKGCPGGCKQEDHDNDGDPDDPYEAGEFFGQPG